MISDDIIGYSIPIYVTVENWAGDPVRLFLPNV